MQIDHSTQDLREEATMIVAASTLALFLAGAVFGATIAHWFDGSGTAWGPLSTSVLIAVIAAEALRRALAKSSAAPLN
jgi:hypothetical protein